MDKLGYIDFILLTVIALAGIRGLFVGLIRELFAFVNLVLGIALASRYAYEMGGWFAQTFGFQSSTLSTSLGFVTIVVLIWIISIALCRMTLYVIKPIFPNYLNRLLGGLFGVFKSFVAIAILLNLMFRIEFIRDWGLTHFSSHSVMYESMQTIASAIIRLDIHKAIPAIQENLPNQEELIDKIEEVKEGVGEALNEGALNQIQNSLPKGE